MLTFPVVLLLCLDVLIFVGAGFLWDASQQKKENLLLSTLFLCSGMPALIYQVVWQRTLFAIYGVNAESVAAVVSAFMLGLGLGGLLGGWLSSRYPRQALILFGLSELELAAHFPLGCFVQCRCGTLLRCHFQHPASGCAHPFHGRNPAFAGGALR